MAKNAGRLMLGIVIAVVAVVGVCLSVFYAKGKMEKGHTCTYQVSEEAFGNPLMGYAPSAWHKEKDLTGDIQLLYMDITWAELEPEEGVYDWAGIEEENQTEHWREVGKHLILRFVCDLPGEEKHMDIPDWLYDKIQGDGTWYDGEYGKGFSPNYENPDLILYHEKAVKALGEHFGQDGLITYVELGSLGHWGEWHVNYGEGIPRLPLEAVRDEYVMPWMEAFPKAHILMRRPFATAEKYGFGLYNDMAGHQKATEEWLQWIQEGGLYEQTEEENGLAVMTDFWKTAPSGGEMTSSLDMKEMLETNLDQTVKLIRDSHTTFLGPKIADQEYKEGYDKVLRNMGYRLWISRAELKDNVLTLTWENDGVAPFYEDWPVYVYVEDESGNVQEKTEIDVPLTAVTNNIIITSATVLDIKELTEGQKKEYHVSIGIEDPMTGQPQVRLAMKDCEYINGRNRLF